MITISYINMKKKYELLKHDTTTVASNGHPLFTTIKTLYRVRRLSDGTLGGYIEDEANLSHDGECFVYNDAQVFDTARVCGNATILNQAQVYGRAVICDEAAVFENAKVYGTAEVGGASRVFGFAELDKGFIKNGELWSREPGPVLKCTQKGDKNMGTLTETANKVRGFLKPYERYLLIAALLIALDHFVLKGALRSRLQKLAQTLADRLFGILDSFISRIGGTYVQEKN